MRRGSQDRSLPLIYIQVFSCLVIAAITVAGILGMGNVAILAPVLAVVGGFVMAGGYYEKARSVMAEALDPSRERDRESRNDS